MRGSLQVVPGRLLRAGPRRRWYWWITDLVPDVRGRNVHRHQVTERLAREQRRAHAQGQYVPEREQRVRPW